VDRNGYEKANVSCDGWPRCVGDSSISPFSITWPFRSSVVLTTCTTGIRNPTLLENRIRHNRSGSLRLSKRDSWISWLTKSNTLIPQRINSLARVQIHLLNAFAHCLVASTLFCLFIAANLPKRSRAFPSRPLASSVQPYFLAA